MASFDEAQILSSLVVIESDLRLSNGLAWHSMEKLLYSTDTESHIIYRRQCDIYPLTGEVILGEREIHLEFETELPDGISLDAAGNLWIAFWGLGAVKQFSPTGELLTEIAVASPNTTSISFIGNEKNTLLITTASVGLSPEVLAQHPLAGSIFTTAVTVPGMPVTELLSAIL